jgi:hypothetical protein
MHSKFRWFVLISLAAVSICATAAQADTVLPVISTSGLDPADFVATYPEVGGINVGSDYTVNASGNPITFTQGGTFRMLTQGGGVSGTSWFLDYPKGTNVLYTGNFFGQGGGPVTINFSTPAVEFGFLFQNNNDHRPATATNSFTLYDGALLLGTYKGTVVSTDQRGNNLIFVGAQVLGGAISQVILTGEHNDFSMGPISYLPDPPTVLVSGVPAPESGSLILFGIGLMSLGGLIRRKLRSAQARDRSATT